MNKLLLNPMAQIGKGRGRSDFGTPPEYLESENA